VEKINKRTTRQEIVFPYFSFQRVVPAGKDARHVRKYEIEIHVFCTTATIFNNIAVIFKENRPALLNTLKLNKFELC
jgi:hypothetical protein